MPYVSYIAWFFGISEPSNSVIFRHFEKNTKGRHRSGKPFSRIFEFRSNCRSGMAGMKVSWVVRLHVMFEYNIDKNISFNISYSNSFYTFKVLLCFHFDGFVWILYQFYNLVPLLLYIAVVVVSSYETSVTDARKHHQLPAKYWGYNPGHINKKFATMPKKQKRKHASANYLNKWGLE